MPDIQPGQIQPVALWCRFELVAGSLSDEEFCAFDFPGCKSEGAAPCPDFRKFGGSHEFGGIARMDRTCLPRKNVVFRSNQLGQPWRSTFTYRTSFYSGNVLQSRTVKRSGTCS